METDDPAQTSQPIPEEEKAEKDENKEETENDFVDDKRLFLMNLSYQTTLEDLHQLFEKYGEVVDVEIPFRKGGRGVPLGIGFVRFGTPEAAISAYAELDKSYYQGRKLHIKPAEKKPPKEEIPEEERPKTEKQEEQERKQDVQ